MKTDFNYHFSIKLIIILVLFLGLFSWQKTIELKAYNKKDIIVLENNNDITEIKIALENPSANKNIGGWAWGSEIGWLSLNCMNDYDNDGILEDSCVAGGSNGTINYGLYVVDSKLKGCAWSDSVGWICFSDPDGSYGGSMDGYAGVGIQEFKYLDTTISSGYAGILGYEYLGGDNYKLGFPMGEEDSIGNPIGCFNCSEIKKCSDTSSPCSTDDDCTEGYYCIHDDYVCDSCMDYTFCEEDSGCDGVYDKNDLMDIRSMYECSGCSNIENASCINSSYTGDELELASCNSCTSAAYKVPGVFFDDKALTHETDDSSIEMHDLCGFAWNGFDVSGALNGIGYLQFSPRITWDFNPYFSVEGGSIYAEGSIVGNQFTRPGSYNASYLIKSGSSIEGMTSLFEDGIIENTQDYNFLDDDFSNILGKIDVDGLTIMADQDINNEYNKYGSIIIPNTLNQDLNDTVFYNNNALTINDSMIFTNKGIVVVDGDLNINNNLHYNGNHINNLNDIPSIVWIVNGDVIINDAVEKIVGTFIILGNNGTDGVFDSGGSDKQLTISGNVMAKIFMLNRTYNEGPAEKFINDGRIQVNPPTGLIDFSKALPRFSNNIN